MEVVVVGGVGVIGVVILGLGLEWGVVAIVPVVDIDPGI